MFLTAVLSPLHPSRSRSLLLVTALLLAPACTGEIVGGGGGPAGDDDLGSGGGPGGKGDDPGDGSGGGVGPGDGGPLVDLGFSPSDEIFSNPDRGYYVSHNLLSGSPGNIRAQGYALAIAIVRLDSWRNSPLPQSLLDQLDTGFAKVRSAGIKLVLRFTYNDGFTDDAPLDVILGHIGQLEPLLQEYADVISVLQAGFIGAWGEWHSSTHGLDNSADRRAVVDAELTALPDTRAIQVRTPMQVDGMFPGGPLTPAEAFDGSERARVGHHNDCFLASSTDQGTYSNPIDTWRGYVAADTRYVPMGGETCAVDAPRTNCPSALAEMEMLHTSYLNIEYYPGVIDGWVSGGCDDEIRRRMGYRLVIEHAAVSQAVAPGGVLHVDVDLHNVGFAAPYNPRPIELVLDDGSHRWTARLAGLDARRLAAGETFTVSADLRVGAELAAGSYRLSLQLPDPEPTLSGDPRNSIRTANQGTWDAVTGDNLLTDALVIDPAAPGGVDPSATGLTDLGSALQ